MRNIGICCFAALCMVLSGCAGNQMENQETGSPEQTNARQETQEQESGGPPQGEAPAPEDNAFSGRWQAVETPQYHMDISLEEDGTLHWIDDFDHTGDDMSFKKE